MPKLNGARSRRSGSRKRQFGETKPNYGFRGKKGIRKISIEKLKVLRIKRARSSSIIIHLIGKKLT